jgi:hypothetical protein
MRNVESDYEPLRIAAREYYEEGWAFKKIGRSLRSGAANREEITRRALPERTVAEAYYCWVKYLAWLAPMHQVVRFADLTAAEAEGIGIISEAREEFLRAHPGCSKCGAMNEKFAMRCRECHAEFGK